MKSRPILFSGPMVRAILNGNKSQTRRIVKPQPNEYIDQLHGGKLRERFPYWLEDENCNPCGKGFQDDQNRFWICPYGQPGDHLWVRETSRAVELPSGLDGVKYIADGHFEKIENTEAASESWGVMHNYRGGSGLIVPAIHMPRWASRITLEITGVRVERVQDISEADAVAEGVTILPSAHIASGLVKGTPNTSPAQLEYYALWESINGPGSWAANPWVWVVEFRRIKP